MILGKTEKLEIGKKYKHRVSDGNGVWHENVPFMVIREATGEEWRTQPGRTLDEYEVPVGCYFYEVSTD